MPVTTLVKFVNHLKEPKKLALAIKGFNALIDTKDLNVRLEIAGYPLYEKVQCFPLETLLRAVNVTYVNFISLDVEGVEMDILKNFLGGNITVDVWIVEHKHPEGMDGPNDKVHPGFIHWFQSKGYTLYTYGPPIPTDYTFIRNGWARYT
ncbi:uncharacterized protein LOC135223051 [Macrobrachium nipponense]|uniref:uncharacterized protein LOC135223051 n=1 Tax=Macrobrachium nipponense TaxID=159736 RepID=UPI0030C84751